MPFAVGRNQPGAGRGIPCPARVDFNGYMDYIHWNPVKHGHVSCVADWPYSIFHRYVRTGIYPADWGDNVTFENDGSFGE